MPTTEYIAEMRVPITADSERDAVHQADNLRDKFEQVYGRDVYVDNVRTMEGGDPDAG